MPDGIIPEIEATGGLPASERMRRIEEAVIRIENKLDGKVGHDDLAPMLQRLQLLESGETPLGRVMLQQWEELAKSVAQLNNHGSREAQDAVRRITTAEADIAFLKTADVSKRASDRQVAYTNERHYKVMTIAVAILMLILVGIQIYASVKGTGTTTVHLVRPLTK